MKRHNKHVLLDEVQIARLEELNFVWYPKKNNEFRKLEIERKRPAVEALWERYFEELLVFKKNVGHCCVPKVYKPNQPMSSWVCRTRQNYRHHKQGERTILTEERIKRLQDIGFVLENTRSDEAFLAAERERMKPKTDAAWDKRFKQLLGYKKKHGYCDVPKIYRPNRALSTWVFKQRSEYKKYAVGKICLLDKEKVEKLEEIGFRFQIHKSPGKRGKTGKLGRQEEEKGADGDELSSGECFPPPRRKRSVARDGSLGESSNESDGGGSGDEIKEEEALLSAPATNQRQSFQEAPLKALSTKMLYAESAGDRDGGEGNEKFGCDGDGDRDRVKEKKKGSMGTAAYSELNEILTGESQACEGRQENMVIGREKKDENALSLSMSSHLLTTSDQGAPPAKTPGSEAGLVEEVSKAGVCLGGRDDEQGINEEHNVERDTQGPCVDLPSTSGKAAGGAGSVTRRDRMGTKVYRETTPSNSPSRLVWKLGRDSPATAVTRPIVMEEEPSLTQDGGGGGTLLETADAEATGLEEEQGKKGEETSPTEPSSLAATVPSPSGSSMSTSVAAIVASKLSVMVRDDVSLQRPPKQTRGSKVVSKMIPQNLLKK